MMTVLALMGILFISGNALALLPDFTKEELISASEHIVLGTVQETHSAWADDHSQIFTYVTLQLSEQFKGENLGSSLVVQIPGGKVGEISQVTSDTPNNLHIGSEVILHLFMQDTGYHWIYGWEKGALSVENGSIPAYEMTVDQFRNLIEITH
ncbi:hypothetical protein KKA00_00900 [bacterium]|nr:hypothetical protein [bacterium]MBU1650749.1 hypothetical protein [bacterium]MBU1881585.1 hypothetical protein [bacterium]